MKIRVIWNKLPKLIFYKKLPPEFPPEYKPETKVILAIFSLLSFLGGFIFTMLCTSPNPFPASLVPGINRQTALSFLCGTFAAVTAALLERAYRISFLPIKLAQVELQKVTMSLDKQRRKLIKGNLMHSLDPAAAVKESCPDAEDFDIYCINRHMGRLSAGNAMYTVNSFDICNEKVLSTASVKKYLEKQSEKTKVGVRIERLFRKMGPSENAIELKEDKLKKYCEIIEEHNDLNFNPAFQVYSSPNYLNPYLDYALIFDEEGVTAYITYPHSKWPTSEGGEKIFEGVKTKDPIVIELLLKDRFQAVSLGYYSYEEVKQLKDKISKTDEKKNSSDKT